MHTVHAGNIAETKTLQGMLCQVLERFPVERVILVADRGLLSLDNVSELVALAEASARKLQFILAVPARRYAELGGTLEGMDFAQSLAEGRSPSSVSLLLTIRCARRSNRAGAESGSQSLRPSPRRWCASSMSKTRGRARAGAGPVIGAYSRFQRAVAEAELTRFIQADYQADRFSYSVDEDAIARAEVCDGKLVVLTNAADFSAAEVVARYKALADIERGFRVLKSDLEIAPVYHRLPDRIRAHALICFLALVLYRIMRMRLKAHGSTASPKTALELLRRIQRHRATIGEHAYSGVSKTTQEQLDLFAALEISKP